jgi:hypothetical protein
MLRSIVLSGWPPPIGRARPFVTQLEGRSRQAGVDLSGNDSARDQAGSAETDDLFDARVAGRPKAIRLLVPLTTLPAPHIPQSHHHTAMMWSQMVSRQPYGRRALRVSSAITRFNDAIQR